MEINFFMLLVLISSTFLFGTCVAKLLMGESLHARELAFITTIYAIIATTVTAPGLYRRVIHEFLNSRTSAAVNRQITKIKNEHRQHIAQLKLAHTAHIDQLRQEIRRMTEDCARAWNEQEWFSAHFHDQWLLCMEQDARIKYLESKLQEYSRSSSTVNPPFSAPATRVRFENSALPPGCDVQAGGEGSVHNSVAMEQVD